MRVLVVDNLDSFTGSLVQQLLTLGCVVHEVRDALPSDTHAYDLVLLSPGPGRPESHPATMAALASSSVPIFGVCLGMQAIALHFGAQVVPAREIVHGRTSPVRHAGAAFFGGLPSPLRATRYHSLATAALPPHLVPLAWTDDGEIMALAHRTLPIAGVQFHPESVRTRHGLALMANVLKFAERRGTGDAP